MSKNRKSLMRNFGEFVGHIWRGVKHDSHKKTIRKTVEEEDRGDVTLRRTTIEEIEFRRHPRPRNDESSQNEPRP